MDLEINSVEELYERLKPALKTKCSEMKRYGITYIKEEDIWNYLKSKLNLNNRKMYFED